MWYEIWKSPTIIEHLNKHLKGMTHDEKIEALKAIIPLVCEGAHVSKNPPTKDKRTPKPETPIK